MTIFVEKGLCKGCGICLGVCPKQAISLRDKKAFIDQEKCTLCQLCIGACPTGAIQVSDTTSLQIFNKQDSEVVLNPARTIETNLKPTSKISTTLYLLGQSLLPRLADILATFVENRLTPPDQKNIAVSRTLPVSNQGYGRRRRFRRGKS